MLNRSDYGPREIPNTEQQGREYVQTHNSGMLLVPIDTSTLWRSRKRSSEMIFLNVFREEPTEQRQQAGNWHCAIKICRLKRQDFVYRCLEYWEIIAWKASYYSPISYHCATMNWEFLPRLRPPTLFKSLQPLLGSRGNYLPQRISS